MTIEGHNIAEDFPGVAPSMSLQEAQRIQHEREVFCPRHGGIVEGLNAIAVLRYGLCSGCAKAEADWKKAKGEAQHDP